MTPDYRVAVSRLPDEVRAHLRSHFSLPDNITLYSGLSSRDLTQADVVLALVRGGTEAGRRAAEALIGRPIVVLPPAVPPRVPVPVAPRERTADERRVIRVGRNPRLPTTPAFQRFRLVRAGLTVSQLLQRGVTRKDLRQLVPEYVQLEGSS